MSCALSELREDDGVRVCIPNVLLFCRSEIVILSYSSELDSSFIKYLKLPHTELNISPMQTVVCSSYNTNPHSSTDHTIKAS